MFQPFFVKLVLRLFIVSLICIWEYLVIGFLLSLGFALVPVGNKQMVLCMAVQVVTAFHRGHQGNCFLCRN